jgi:hypothetical protein
MDKTKLIEETRKEIDMTISESNILNNKLKMLRKKLRKLLLFSGPRRAGPMGDAIRRADREYQRKKRARLKGYKTEEHRKYRLNNPVKSRAQTVLNIAVRSGKILRKPCSVCNDPNSHGHHEDYEKPLDVLWLCPIHHKEAHTKKTTKLVDMTSRSQ